VILRCVLLRVFLVSDASFRSLLTCDGYLKQNLCTTAAYRPVRELIQQEILKDLVSVFFFYRFNYSMYLEMKILCTTILLQECLKIKFKFLFFPHLSLFAGEKPKS
jgi:hypothetical protein